MVKLVEITSHASLITEMVAMFAFMKAMSRPEDCNSEVLDALSLDDVYKKADDFFLEFTDELGMIITSECNLDEKIDLFLKEWEYVTDVMAVHQNINYRLRRWNEDD